MTYIHSCIIMLSPIGKHKYVKKLEKAQKEQHNNATDHYE